MQHPRDNELVKAIKPGGDAKSQTKPQAKKDAAAKPQIRQGRQALMPDLRQTRKDLKTALAIMAGVDLLAAIVYFSPLVGSAESRRMQMNQLQTELNNKTRQVAPLKDLPKKVEIASKQIGDFYQKRFPTTELGDSDGTRQAGARKWGCDRVRENTSFPTKKSGTLQPVEMEYDLSGNYTSLAKFINAVERDEMFFVINSVTLGGEPHGAVKLNVKLETYLKAGS